MTINPMSKRGLTTIISEELKGFIDNYRSSSIDLLTIDTVIDDVNKITVLGDKPIEVVQLRDVNQIFQEGLYRDFPYDNVIMFVSILRELGTQVSYAVYVQEDTLDKTQEPTTKPFAIVTLGDKRYLVDVIGHTISRFKEKFGQMAYCFEGLDPLDMGIETTNDLLRKIQQYSEERRISLGDLVFMGVHGKRGEVKVQNNYFKMPENFLNAIARRNGRHFKDVDIYLLTKHHDGLSYVALLDQKAFDEEVAGGFAIDHRDINRVRIDESKGLPLQLHDILEISDGKGNLVLESTELGNSVRMWGYGAYLFYSEKTREQQQLFEKWPFDFRHSNFHKIDERYRVASWQDVLKYFLVRRGIISDTEFSTMNMEQLEERLKQIPEKIRLYYHVIERRDKTTDPAIIRVYDFKPPREMYQNVHLFDAVVTHDNRTVFGIEILNALFSPAECYLFNKDPKGFKVNLEGRGSWFFDVVIDTKYKSQKSK